VGEDEAAFSERSAKYLMSVEGSWHDPADDDTVIAWVRETWSEISEFGTGTTYINFAEGESQSVVDDAFGTKLEKLSQIKAKYDPENFFRRNNNILPAA
jgi:FAD/FMN-containing dehydrogenase